MHYLEPAPISNSAHDLGNMAESAITWHKSTCVLWQIGACCVTDWVLSLAASQRHNFPTSQSLRGKLVTLISPKCCMDVCQSVDENQTGLLALIRRYTVVGRRCPFLTAAECWAHGCLRPRDYWRLEEGNRSLVFQPEVLDEGFDDRTSPGEMRTSFPSPLLSKFCRSRFLSLSTGHSESITPQRQTGTRWDYIYSSSSHGALLP